MKNIAALLNSEGGSLLIGVSDDGLIKGVNPEIDKFHKGNHDNFLKYIKNKIKTRIGEQFYTYFDYQLVDVNDFWVLIFTCKSSDIPCYLDSKDFYVRTNPATDKLDGPKLVEYVSHHFTRQ
jgi:predicted HTH transcriptional regulator